MLRVICMKQAQTLYFSGRFMAYKNKNGMLIEITENTSVQVFNGKQSIYWLGE